MTNKQENERMAVDRDEMVKGQFLEHGAAGDVAAGMLDRAGNRPVDALAEIGVQLLADLAHAHIGPAGCQPRQIGAPRAGRRRDPRVLVVENDVTPTVERAGFVCPPSGQAGRYGSVATPRPSL